MRKLIIVVLVFLLSATVFAQTDGYTVTDIPHESLGYNAALSPDGETLAVWHHYQIYGGEPLPGYAITLFNLTNGLRRGALPGATDYITNAVFSPDGTQLISSHSNGDVNIWDVESDSIIRTIETLILNVRVNNFMPDGQTVALFLSGDPTRIALMDVETGALTRMLGTHFDTMSTFVDNIGDISYRGTFTLVSAAFDAAGQLAVSNANGDVMLWDVETNDPTVIYAADEEGPMPYTVRDMRWTSDGSLIYSYRPAEGIMMLEGDDFSPRVLNTGAVEAFALHPDGDTLAYVTREGLYLSSLSAPQNAEPITLPGVEGELAVNFGLAQLMFTADGSHLVLAGLRDPDEVGNHIYVVAFD